MLEEKQFRIIESYFEGWGPNSKLTASGVSAANGLDFRLTQQVLKALVKEHLLKCSFGVRCPKCGLLLASHEDIATIDKEQYCYNCDENVEIDPEDVEVIYTFENYPFVDGQQSESSYKLDESAARARDSLAELVKSGALDLNSEFFSPTDEEYKDLQFRYNEIFARQQTTKAKGDTLEALTITLFNLCKHFRVAPIRLNPNQIDCYVRNTLYIPGISQSDCVDSFEIECKNETKPPKAGYMNKLHGIMRVSGKKFGIIVSKCAAPKTFNTLAHQIYLKDDMIIIAFDKFDIESIVFKKVNLLECMSRKIDAVKLNATKDLVELGLYDG